MHHSTIPIIVRKPFRWVTEEGCLSLVLVVQLATVEAVRLFWELVLSQFFSWEWEPVLDLARSSEWPAMKSEPRQLIEKAARCLSETLQTWP